jgi:predicted Zn-dependent peptidase
VYPGFGRADLLASFALMDGDATRINSIDERFGEVTPALVHEVAREYLRPDRRSVLSVVPGAVATTGAEVAS